MKMSQALRNDIGKALYDATMPTDDSRTPQWDAIANKEEWILKATKVLEAYHDSQYNTFLIGGVNESA